MNKTKKIERIRKAAIRIPNTGHQLNAAKLLHLSQLKKKAQKT